MPHIVTSVCTWYRIWWHLILTGVLRCHIMSFIHLDDFLRVRNHLSQTEPFYRIFSQLWACLPSIAFSPPHQYEISHFMNYHNPICLEIALITKQKVALILTKFVLKSLSWWKSMLIKSWRSKICVLFFPIFVLFWRNFGVLSNRTSWI